MIIEEWHIYDMNNGFVVTKNDFYERVKKRIQN